jgi:hypothetical protein
LLSFHLKTVIINKLLQTTIFGTLQRHNALKQAKNNLQVLFSKRKSW